MTTPPAKLKGLNTLPNYCCSSASNCTLCRNLDGLSLYWPVESGAITVASYVKERFETQVCGQATYNFAEYHTAYIHVWERDFYTVHPENALLKIEHSIKADGGKFSAPHRMMEGELVDTSGTVIKKLKRNAINKIYMKDFLDAANVNLSDVSDAVNAEGRTFRRMGVVLHVVVDYRNSDVSWFGVSPTSYKYRVDHVRYSDYKVKQEIPIVYSNGSTCARIVNKRFGPRLEFQQVGKIGQHSLGNLLMQLVSFMGLLTLTATIIDVCALYLVPARETYKKYVYDTSPELQNDDGEIAEDNEKEGKQKNLKAKED